VNNCVNWTFINKGGKMRGIASWESGEEAGEEAVLEVDTLSGNEITISRTDVKGPKQGQTITYTGRLHGKQVGGEYSSEFNGHNDSGNWYWVCSKDDSRAGPVSLPSEMHYCVPGSDCISMHLYQGRYVWHSRRGSGQFTVSSFTRKRLTLDRVDVSGFTGHYTGEIVGKHLENVVSSGHPFTPDWRPGEDTSNRTTLFAWGSELNSIPGDEGVLSAGVIGPGTIQPGRTNSSAQGGPELNITGADIVQP
jgi:hypothetical protein